MAFFRKTFILLSLLGFVALPISAFSADEEDEDEAISLSPVKKGDGLETPTSAPTAAPVLAATAVVVVATPTAVPPTPTTVPTPKPTPKPKPAIRLNRIEDLSFRQDSSGVHLSVVADRPLRGSVKVLKNPDRLLVEFANTVMVGRSMTREINLGAAVRARLAVHPNNSVWLVVDLVEPVQFRVNPDPLNSYSLTLETGLEEKPSPPRRIADLPRVNLMFFDINVLFQGRQYDRFPCANFIYDKSDTFPLKREFVTTLVFHQGYGAFVGNLRLVDPKGQVLDHTKEPIAFNLFSELFDYSVEVPWKVEFPMKGFYSLILTLNGEDVLEHRFYVGHNDDKAGARK